MSDELYDKIVFLIVLFGSISIFVLFEITIFLYKNSSIISYIANRG